MEELNKPTPATREQANGASPGWGRKQDDAGLGMPLTAGAPRLGLSDVYYVLFRQKWKIIACAIAGFVAAAVVYFSWSTTYVSEAKLFIRYLQESRVPTVPGDDARVRIPENTGAAIVTTEVEILTSSDVALEVANAVGP